MQARRSEGIAYSYSASKGQSVRAVGTRITSGALLKVKNCGVKKCLKCKSKVLCEVLNVIQILNCSVFCSSFVTWCETSEDKDSGER